MPSGQAAPADTASPWGLQPSHAGVGWATAPSVVSLQNRPFQGLTQEKVAGVTGRGAVDKQQPQPASACFVIAGGGL